MKLRGTFVDSLIVEDIQPVSTKIKLQHLHYLQSISATKKKTASHKAMSYLYQRETRNLMCKLKSSQSSWKIVVKIYTTNKYYFDLRFSKRCMSIFSVQLLNFLLIQASLDFCFLPWGHLFIFTLIYYEFSGSCTNMESKETTSYLVFDLH